MPGIEPEIEKQHSTLTGISAKTERDGGGEERERWFKKHKKAVTLGLIGLIGGAAAIGAYYKFVYEPEQKKAPAVVDAAIRSLYPLDELMVHDMLGRTSKRAFHDVLLSRKNFALALEFGIINMKYNPAIGNSPFLYIYNLLLNDIKEKNERYKEAYSSIWIDVPVTIWTCSDKFWSVKIGEYYYSTNESLTLINSDPEAAVIKGYPPALKRNDIPRQSQFLHIRAS